MTTAPATLPLKRFGLWLTLGGAICAGVLVGIMQLLAADPLHTKAALAACIATTGAAIASLLPVQAMRKMQPATADFAWLYAMPVRFGLSLIAATLLATLGRLPIAATILSMVVCYSVLLVIETTLMYQFMQKLAKETR
jgi:hypothetical protein